MPHRPALSRSRSRAPATADTWRARPAGPSGLARPWKRLVSVEILDDSPGRLAHPLTEERPTSILLGMNTQVRMTSFGYEYYRPALRWGGLDGGARTA